MTPHIIINTTIEKFFHGILPEDRLPLVFDFPFFFFVGDLFGAMN